jgi:hypothetical protein
VRAKVCCRSLGSAPRSADTGLSQAGPEKARQNRSKPSLRAKTPACGVVSAEIRRRISACRPGGDENWVDDHEARPGRHSLRRHSAGTTPQPRAALQVRERPSRLSALRSRISPLGCARSAARHARACAKEYSRMPGTKTSEKSWKTPPSGITKRVRSRSSWKRRPKTQKLTDSLRDTRRGEQAHAISKRRRIGHDGTDLR